MRIAIAAFQFDNQQHIGSKRTRNLAREWAEAGHEVTVFTPGDSSDQSSPFPGVRVVRLGDYGVHMSPQTGLQGLIRKGLLGVTISETVPRVRALKRKLANGTLSADEDREARELNRRRQSSVLRVDLLLAERIFAKNIKSFLRSSDIDPNEFDVLVSRSSLMGRALNDEGYGRKWVHDFDDPATSEAFLRPLNHYLRVNQTGILRDVDLALAVSNGVKETVTLSTKAAPFTDKITVVPNGFVLNESSSSTSPGTLERKDDTLNIGFTGQINARLEPELRRFFTILRQALAEVGDGSIVFHYAGISGDLVMSIASELGVEESVRSYGLVPHEVALELQQGMDALLLISRNNPGARGILTGKFPEYLGASKPIIALVGGTLPNSELGEIIERCQVGVCSERARGEAADTLLLNTLVSWASERMAGRSVPFGPVDTYVQEFNYTNLASRILKLLEANQ